MVECINANKSELEKLVEAADNGDLLEALLGCEPKEFTKEIHEKCFADEEEEEGLSTSRLTECMDTLINSSKTLKSVEDNNKKFDKEFSSMLKAIDKARNTLVGKMPSNANKNVSVDIKNGDTEYGMSQKTGTDAMASLNAMTKIINIGNTAFSKFAAANIAETKFKIKQARRVFAQAAAFNAKAVKENALLVEAAGDAAEYEVESSFNDYEM